MHQDDSNLEWDIDSALDRYVADLGRGRDAGRAAEASALPVPPLRAPQFFSNMGEAAATGFKRGCGGMAGLPAQPRMGKPALLNSPFASASTTGGNAAGPQPTETQEEIDKALAIQEKNRRAQKRFRARQKARVRGMEERLVELTVQVRGLRSENLALRNRNAELEKAFAIHSEAPAEGARIPEASADSAWRQPAAAQAQPTTPSPVPATASASHGGRMSASSPTSSPGAAQSQPALSSGPPMGADGGGGGGAGVSGPPKSEAELAATRWKEGVEALATLLVEMESSGYPPDAMHRLVDVAAQAGAVCLRAVQSRPVDIKKLMQGPAAEADSQPDLRWLSVVRAMQLTPEQKQEVLALRKGYLQRKAMLLDQRHTINLQIQAAPAKGKPVMAGMMSLRECMAELKINLREEHDASVELASSLFKQVMTPMQFARAAVQAYPLHPDALAIAHCLALDEGVAQPLAPNP